MKSHHLDLDLPVDDSLTAVAGAAEHWGADWQRDSWGGRLALPVIAGLRRGRLVGRISVRETGEGTRLTLDVEGTELTVNRPAVAVLATGGAGGLAVALWPFWPPLLGLAPLGIVLAFSAWFLVNSRLRHAGAEDFLELIAEEAQNPSREDPEGDSV